MIADADDVDAMRAGDINHLARGSGPVGMVGMSVKIGVAQNYSAFEAFFSRLEPAFSASLAISRPFSLA